MIQPNTLKWFNYRASLKPGYTAIHQLSAEHLRLAIRLNVEGAMFEHDTRLRREQKARDHAKIAAKPPVTPLSAPQQPKRTAIELDSVTTPTAQLTDRERIMAQYGEAVKRTPYTYNCPCCHKKLMYNPRQYKDKRTEKPTRCVYCRGEYWLTPSYPATVRPMNAYENPTS